ncbi:MAG TPA: PEP-CTERM sorting domain-containing protein [Edaphobacter sp.]|jgi:hypothetical protein|nr:PEP-CTERM sorting domain-containing protein [Edaphobacter sp.]
MRNILFALALIASLSIPLTAHADAIDQFTFSFATPPGYLTGDLVIDLPASPVVSTSLFGPGVCHLDCFSVYGEANGIQYVVDFFQQLSPGGGTIVQYAATDPYYGPPNTPRAYRSIFAQTLFSGSVADPTFLTGTFDAEYRPFSSSPEFAGTITIEPVNNSTVPEPSTFTLMATGILGAITTLKSRKLRAGIA